MKDEDKSKEQLIEELIACRQEIALLKNQFTETTASPSQHSELDLLRIVIDSLPDFIVIKDIESRFVLANIAVTQYAGFSSPDELIGKSDFDFYPLEQAQIFYEDEQRIVQTGESIIRQLEISNLLSESQTRYLSTSKIPYKNEADQIVGIVVMARDITENKLTQDILIQRERLLKTLFEVVPVGISILDDNYTITEMNPALQHILDLSLEDLLAGKYRQRRYINSSGKQMHREDFPSYRAVVEQRTISDIEIGVVKEDEQVVWTSVGAAPLELDGYSVVIATQDITERKQAEKALQDNESYLRTLTNSMADAIFTVNMPERRIEYVNAALEKIFGYSPDEIIGEQTRIFYPNDEGFLHFGGKLRDALTNGQSQLITEHILARKNGENFWASIATTFLYAEGELSQVISIVRDISARKKLEHALQESEQRLTNILNFSINAIIAIDSDHKILIYNKGAERIFGYSAEEILGQSLNKLLPERNRANHSAHIDQFSLSPETARQMNSRKEIYGLRRDGSEFPAEASISKFVQNDTQIFTVMLQDISERKQLESEANIYHAAVEASSELIIVFDKAYRFAAVNQVYLDYHQEKREEIIGKTIEEVLGVNFFNTVIKERFDRCLKGEVQDFDASFVYPLLGERHLLVNYSPLADETGEIGGVVVVMRDITEQKRAEEQAFAYRIRQEKVNILANFIQDASHEFRTPLSVIQSSLYLMNKTNDAERKRQKSAQIEEQIKHMTRLVNMLTKMSKLDMGIQLEWAQIDINEMIQHIISEQSIEQIILEKGLVIESDLLEIPIITGDVEFLSEAMKQILDNAIRFTGQHGKITIHSSSSDNSISIEIHDNGVGIPEEDMPHIFERFYRADVAHTTRGFGLGLPMAKAIVEQHKGAISISSNDITGTTVIISLPIGGKIETEYQS